MQQRMVLKPGFQGMRCCSRCSKTALKGVTDMIKPGRLDGSRSQAGLLPELRKTTGRGPMTSDGPSASTGRSRSHSAHEKAHFFPDHRASPFLNTYYVSGRTCLVSFRMVESRNEMIPRTGSSLTASDQRAKTQGYPPGWEERRGVRQLLVTIPGYGLGVFFSL